MYKKALLAQKSSTAHILQL